ncbi:hypothetical protein NADFUDRAFT_51010 [Nadsonia fulvescens var. elongata DSM 6958]|uniref:SH3 domain-containing protein n=1 Tax=Nadsonia fulvescens var. elongata DSM 6958 TaxID=857566 RepID=A0A1E3PJV2_9ASCO|nr:hypothetical protein NADFUDRAFT_51010 [Nadsonia fulvescens var. elongata DSM 6958]
MALASAFQEDLNNFAFSNNFWGQDDKGVSNMLSRLHHAKLTCEEIQDFYKERVAIEEEYSRRLLSLSRKPLGSHEVGSLKKSLETIRLKTETMGKSHKLTAQQIKGELFEPLNSFATSLRGRRKTVQSTIEKVLKSKITQTSLVEKERENYVADCHKINGFSAQQNLLLGKELERNNQKLDKAHISIEISKREYQNALRALGETVDRWNMEWKTSCDKFQDLEEERLSFLKSNLWAYTNIVSTVCVSDDEVCEDIRVSLEKCDIFGDIREFVQAKGTGGQIVSAPEFINYQNGYSDEVNRLRFQIAHFPRESTIITPEKLNDSSNTSLPQSTSMHSISDVPRPTSASANHQQQQQQKSYNPYSNAAALGSSKSVNSVHTRRDTEITQSKPSMPNTLSTGALNSTTGPQSISKPMVAQIPRNTSPIHKVPVPVSSANSNTSSSAGSNTGPTTSSLILDSNTPATSAPTSSSVGQSTSALTNPTPVLTVAPMSFPVLSPYHAEPVSTDATRAQSPTHARHDSDNNLEYDDGTDDRKLRTWSSPFRRRSKKDPNRGWNSKSPSLNNSLNSSTSSTGGTVGFNNKNNNNNSTNAGASNNNPSSPYNMYGHNKNISTDSRASGISLGSISGTMFDIKPASETIKNSSRSRLSPTKQLDANDPLVAALQKLKVVTPNNNNSSMGDKSKYGNLGSVAATAKSNRRVPSRSEPSSPTRLDQSIFAAVPPIATSRNTHMPAGRDYGQPISLSQSNIQSQQQQQHQHYYQHSQEQVQQVQIQQQHHIQQLQHQHTHQHQFQHYQPQQQSIPQQSQILQNSQQQTPHQLQRPKSLYDIHDSQRIRPSSADPYQQQQPTSAVPKSRSIGQGQPPLQQQHIQQQLQQQRQYTQQQQQQHTLARPKSFYEGSTSSGQAYENYQSKVTPYPENAPPQQLQPQSSFTIKQTSHSSHELSRPEYNVFKSQSNLANISGGQDPIRAPGIVAANIIASGMSEGSNRPRSKSAQDQRPDMSMMRPNGDFSGNKNGGTFPSISRDGRPVIKYCKAAYDYRAAIPEEVSFRKGDVMMVLRMQEDGWWEVEVLGSGSRVGLAPSNFMVNE